MKIKTILKRFRMKEEINNILEEDAKKANKKPSEFIEDLIHKNRYERDNRLTNHIARDSENLILLQILNQNKSYSNIEEVYKDVNIINNDKKIYLAEKRKQIQGEYKEIKSFFNLKYFNEIIESYKIAKDTKSKKSVLENAFNNFLSIVKKYEK